MNSTKGLRIAGILEIVAGVLSIILIQMLLGSNAQVSLDQAQATNALAGLVGLYAADGFKIIAGIIGICMASKKSILTVILGVLLFIAQLWSFVQAQGNMALIIVQIVLLVVPYLYLSSAWKNYKA